MIEKSPRLGGGLAWNFGKLDICKHKKRYEEKILLTTPPQYPWVCEKCGFRGVDERRELSD